MVFADSPKTITISCDLDGTLVYLLQKQTEHYQDFQFDGKYYRFSDYAGEFLDAVMQLSNENLKVQLAFNSGGEKSRNEFLLKQLHLPFQNVSAYELTNPSLILSREDLTPVQDADPKSRFSLRYKKDLSKMSLNLENIVHIDDDPYFMPHNQKSNLIWLGTSFFFTPRFENHPEAIHPKAYLPKTNFEWRTEKNKLVWTLGVLIKTIEIMKNQDLSPKEALKTVLPQNFDQTLDHQKNWEYFYNLGSSRLKSLEKKYNLQPHLGLTCNKALL